MIKIENKTEVRVHSIPLFDDSLEVEWAYTKIDTSFTIENKRFDELCEKVINLQDIDFSRAFSYGEDGNDCTIEYGTRGSKVSYQFWTPESGTEERNLTYFYELCKEFLKIGNLNPDEIFEH